MARTDHDPHDVSGRLYMHMVRLLDRLDTDQSMTIRERVQAMLGLGHLLRDFAALRKESGDEDAGTAARNYESAFDAARRRAGDPRPDLDAAADHAAVKRQIWAAHPDLSLGEAGEHDDGGD